MGNELLQSLYDTRQRTLELISPLKPEDLFLQHDPLMSPIIWDIGHIGHFEELWGVRSFNNGDAVRPEYDSMYDAMSVPRAIRNTLPLPDLTTTLSYLGHVRELLIANLEQVDPATENPLLRDGYLVSLLLQHEQQHNETLIATLQLKKGTPYHPAIRVGIPGGISDDNRDRKPTVEGMVLVTGGSFKMGTDDRLVAYDNERPCHDVDVPAFMIARAPVTNGEFAEFVGDGGYQRPDLWQPQGFAFIESQGITAPKYWAPDGTDGWITRSMDFVESLNPRRPVSHVCWYEADAYARWAGMRLPSEAEWEKAAAWNPATGDSMLYPWGSELPKPIHANLDQRGWMASEVGAWPAGVSPVGCYGMIGDVWEWTSSNFLPYPGFKAFPYDEYSSLFFGTDYRVLRGGSWATRVGAIRNTFRNWDYPIRRQIFSGFRLATDL